MYTYDYVHPDGVLKPVQNQGRPLAQLQNKQSGGDGPGKQT